MKKIDWSSVTLEELEKIREQDRKRSARATMKHLKKMWAAQQAGDWETARALRELSSDEGRA
jgi:hypothetical protein